MRYLLSIFFLFFCLSAFSQGTVDRIELGYATTKRGIEWTRPGLPTHVPVWRLSRDTNTIIWHDKNTGIRYDWDYLTSVWYARGRFSSALPPLPTQTSGLAAIDNRTGFWLNASNILHRYDIAQTAWVPLKITYQSAAPTNVAAGVSNGAAIYTTTLWQDSDDFLIRFWDGDSWELIGGGTDLTFSGASSPVTLNSSTGTDVTITAGTNISLAATGTNLTINNTGAAALSGVVNQVPYFNTSTTITTEAGSGTNALTWNPTNNFLGVGVASPLYAVHAEQTGGADSFVGMRVKDLSSASTGIFAGSLRDAGNSFSLPGIWLTNSTPTFLNYAFLADGSRTIFNAPGSQDINFRTNNGNVMVILNAGNVGIGVTSPQKTLHVQGTARITSSDGTATTIMGRDADGDISALSLSGMSISAGTLTATDGSVTNEAWTIDADDTDTEVISNQTVKFQGGGINVTDYIPGTDILTITGTEVDGSISNEGVLGVGAGSGTSSTILSTTSGANAVTINAAGILGISESTSANGGSITLTATEVDGSTTNELQTIANTSNSTSHTATLSNSGGSLQIIEGAGVLLTTGGTGLNGTVTIEAIDPSTTNEIQTYSASGAGPTSYDMTVSSGGTVTLAEGTGIDLTRSGNTITVASTGITSATGYINGGNSFGGAATIGLNDNFDWSFETNGATRGWIDNAGTYTIGSTILTTAALNISGLQNGIGMHVAGGTGLVSPVMLQTRGNGSGSTVLVLDAQHSFLNGNVEALIQNTSTSGTGGALLTLNVDESATGDPKVVYTTAGTTTWAHGIDNSASGEPWRLTDNSDIGSGTSTITANTSNQVGINQNTPLVQLQVTGTDAIGIPTGTTAQRSAAAIPQIRHNNTFSGLEFYDHNKGYYYRLTAVSIPTVASNAAAGTGHSANVLAGELSSDVRGVIELNTGSASMAVGTVVTVTYASAYSGTKTVVLLDAGNDIAATQKARYRVDTQSNTGFTIRAVTALDINETYVFKYYVGQ